MDIYDLASNKLRHIEPNFNMKISLSILRYVGSWPPRGRYRSLYIFYAIINFVMILGIYLLSEIAYIVIVWGDAKKVVSGTFLLMTNAGLGYKMILIFLRQKRIEALLRVMNSEIFSSHNVEHERVLTWYTWYGIRDHVTFVSFAVVAVTLLGLASIADAVTGREKRLPMGGWYPYNTNVTPMFEITFAQQIIGMIILAIQNTGVDVLVTNFLIVTCSQLNILRRNIEAIGNETDDEKFDNFEASRKLNSCIEHNKAIIRFQKEIQSIFGGSILLQCFVNCAIICVTAFHISQMTDYVIAEMIGTFVYLGGMTYQIFLYCWHGNELTKHSESIAFGAYHGNWWKLNERYKSALRIVVIRSHKPLSIKVGGIITISLETFMSIIRMSYSLFTVLQQTTVD